MAEAPKEPQQGHRISKSRPGRNVEDAARRDAKVLNNLMRHKDKRNTCIFDFIA